VFPSLLSLDFACIIKKFKADRVERHTKAVPPQSVEYTLSGVMQKRPFGNVLARAAKRVQLLSQPIGTSHETAGLSSRAKAGTSGNDYPK
jgi:hypothetical protein